MACDPKIPEEKAQQSEKQITYINVKVALPKGNFVRKQSATFPLMGA